MTSSRRSPARVIAAVMSCALLSLFCGCQSSEPPAKEPAPEERAAAVPPVSDTPEAEASETPAHREALPRTVVGVALGMSRADAEGKLGPLTCHENKAGFQVCGGVKEPADDVSHLELYLHHEHVISVSYESPAPKDAWDALNRLIDRYGHPSLSGLRERDKSGRLHEIYGWKDDMSLYSVRFVWTEDDGGNSKLVSTAIALWDRKGYQQWEAESKPDSEPKATPDEPQEPI